MDKKNLVETELNLARAVADEAAAEIVSLETQLELEREGQLKLLEDLLHMALGKKAIFKQRVIYALTGVAALQTFVIVLLLVR